MYENFFGVDSNGNVLEDTVSALGIALSVRSGSFDTHKVSILSCFWSLETTSDISSADKAVKGPLST